MTLFGRRLLKALSIPDYLIIHKKQPAGRAPPGFGNLAQRMLTLIFQTQQASVLYGYEQIMKNDENGFPIANKKVIAWGNVTDDAAHVMRMKPQGICLKERANNER